MDVKDMIDYLENNGYKVVKLTNRMKEDIKYCHEDADCFACSCNTCILEVNA